MTDTMVQKAANEAFGMKLADAILLPDAAPVAAQAPDEQVAPNELLRRAIQRHQDADKECDKAEELLEKARKELRKAWEAAGGPTGKFKMWLFAKGDMIVELSCDEGDFHYSLSELKSL